MECGISTACFFPEDTIVSLHHVGEAGAKVTEVFLNTFSELEDSYVARLLDTVKQYNLRVASLHPFSSAMEGFFFASRYAQRYIDGEKLYRRLFEVCRLLGAPLLVFHGPHKDQPYLDAGEYAATFCRLAAVGREYGVALCHENIAYGVLNNPAAVRRFTPIFGGDAAFVLDMKQAVRAGHTPTEMLAAMGERVRHVHISDSDEKADCIPPGTGGQNFPQFIGQLQQAGYHGDVMIELYRDGYGAPRELTKAMQYIQNMLQ